MQARPSHLCEQVLIRNTTISPSMAYRLVLEEGWLTLGSPLAHPFGATGWSKGEPTLFKRLSYSKLQAIIHPKNCDLYIRLTALDQG